MSHDLMGMSHACHMTYCVCVCVCVCVCCPLTQQAAGYRVVEEQDHRGQVGIEVHTTGCFLQLHNAQSTVTMETNELQKLEQSPGKEREHLQKGRQEVGVNRSTGRGGVSRNVLEVPYTAARYPTQMSGGRHFWGV